MAKAVRRFLESMPIFAMFGARLVQFAAETSELEMPWRRDLTYDGTAIPATVTGALIDFAGGSAAATLLPQGWGIMTTGFEVHNIAPATGQRMVALGETPAHGQTHRPGPRRCILGTGRQAHFMRLRPGHGAGGGCPMKGAGAG